MACDDALNLGRTDETFDIAIIDFPDPADFSKFCAMVKRLRVRRGRGAVDVSTRR